MLPLKAQKQKPIFDIWWKVAPLTAHGFIVLWVVSVLFAMEFFEPFELCTRHSTNCDWLIEITFWILPLAVLWHIGLVFVAKPRWKYFIYGLVNSLLLCVVWLIFTVTLMDKFGMLS